jgi:hypothetical protein
VRRLWVTWFLEWRVLREAGFTEQRLPPALGSGRITGQWQLDPTRPVGLTPVGPSLFLFFFTELENHGFWLNLFRNSLELLCHHGRDEDLNQLFFSCDFSDFIWRSLWAKCSQTYLHPPTHSPA